MAGNVGAGLVRPILKLTSCPILVSKFEILVLRHHISECKYLFYCSALCCFWYGCFYYSYMEMKV